MLTCQAVLLLLVVVDQRARGLLTIIVEGGLRDADPSMARGTAEPC